MVIMVSVFEVSTVYVARQIEQQTNTGTLDKMYFQMHLTKKD